MPEVDQLELIDAHPRLGAPPAEVSALSYREQGYDREAAELEADRVATELDRLNRAYEARFGFRFCVFVNGRSRAALLPVMETALAADRAIEIRRALGEVIAIAADRARTLLG
jgi:2-oxo-4-hydroxy-4-carboxy--5-ureidoimidazoline (OHCU) decarboxylase